MKIISHNKKAYHNYNILETLEAGLVLHGSEVKAMRMAHVSVAESYAMIRNNEAWLVNMHIPLLKHASYLNHAERRDRKLLLSRREIDKLDRATAQKGFTLVPLKVYFNQDNRIKVQIGLGKGKALYDKRQSLKDKDMARDAARERSGV